MLLDEQSTRELKAYLLTQLESISDTDVQMLADYIVALLKHDKTLAELKAVCLEQLTDFLGSNTGPFVEKLFQFLPSINKQPAQAAERAPITSRLSAAPSPSSMVIENNNNQQAAKSGWSSPEQQQSVGRRTREQSANERFQSGWDDQDTQMQENNGNGGYGGNSRPSSGNNRPFRRDNGYDNGGRGGGRFGGRYNNNQQQQQQQGKRTRSETVEIQSIPAEHLGVKQICGYFSRFGQLKRVSIDHQKERAFVEFSSIDEAYACVSSPEAPFNNRFVRILFYNDPMPADAVDVGVEQQQQQVQLLSAEEREQKRLEAEKMRQNLAEKMELLQRQQEEERRRLMEKIGQVSQQDRQQILSSLSNVSKTILTTEHVLQAAPVSQQRHSAENLAAASGGGSGAMDVLEQVKKMPSQTADDLKAQLEMLKREHDQMGQTDSQLTSPTTATPTALRGGRGASRGGRGRGARGGRGGMMHPYARPTKSLDLRPKTIKVTKIPPTLTEPLLKQHFGKFGVVSSVNNQPDGVIVQFAARWYAEQAIQKAGQLDDGSELELSWYSAGPQQQQQQAEDAMETNE